MKGKSILIPGIFLLVVFVSGCIIEDTPPPGGSACASPKKTIGAVCCYDENSNNVCDMDEAGCPASCDDGNPCTNNTCSADSNFQCTSAVIPECCGNDVCEQSEDLNNICPADCKTIDITDFQYVGTPDYIEGGTFVFIHTASAEIEYRLFALNITAGDNTMENIRYTFKCNSTQNTDLDSIDSEPDNVSDELDLKIHKLDDTNYLIFSNFFLKRSPTYGLDIEKINPFEMAQFQFSINMKAPQ